MRSESEISSISLQVDDKAGVSFLMEIKPRQTGGTEARSLSIASWLLVSRIHYKYVSRIYKSTCQYRLSLVLS